ncbi:hypothetical protein C8Q79DRAFT_392357 [Trametes meyenii]|nr:hypothetical protein C8Q79DRAFT_392357 [Trametes meyenii]
MAGVLLGSDAFCRTIGGQRSGAGMVPTRPRSAQFDFFSARPSTQRRARRRDRLGWEAARGAGGEHSQVHGVLTSWRGESTRTRTETRGKCCGVRVRVPRPRPWPSALPCPASSPSFPDRQSSWRALAPPRPFRLFFAPRPPSAPSPSSFTRRPHSSPVLISSSVLPPPATNTLPPSSTIMHGPPPPAPASPSPPSTDSDPHSDGPDNRFSKASYDSAPSSYPASSTHLVQDRSFFSYPSISYRFTAFSSSPSLSLASDSPYLGPSRPLSLGDQYTFSPDPQKWGADLSLDYKEEDDDLHTPEPAPQGKGKWIEHDSHVFSWRGIVNLGALLLLITGILILL